MNEKEKLHTIRQVAKMTGISEYFLRKNIRDGNIKVIMCGNRAKLSISMLMGQLGITSTADAEQNNWGGVNNSYVRESVYKQTARIT